MENSSEFEKVIDINHPIFSFNIDFFSFFGQGRYWSLYAEKEIHIDFYAQIIFLFKIQKGIYFNSEKNVILFLIIRSP